MPTPAGLVTTILPVGEEHPGSVDVTVGAGGARVTYSWAASLTKAHVAEVIWQ